MSKKLTSTSNVQLPGVTSQSGLEQLAALPTWSPGEMHGLAVREILREIKKAKGNHSQAVKGGIARLESDTLLTPNESKQLSAIVDIVHSRIESGSILEQVQVIHDKLLLDKNASPIALVIASIAVNSINTVHEKELNLSVGQADVGGAISGANTGATIGGAAGGLGGAIAGGIIGGIVGGAVASASANKATTP
jgi:hypothetical protein